MTGYKTFCEHPRTDDMAQARENALQHDDLKERVNCYWLHGPVPRVTCRPIEDFAENIHAQDEVVELILDGAPADVFNWSEPETPESVQANRLATVAWNAIKRLPQRKPEPEPEPWEDGSEPF